MQSHKYEIRYGIEVLVPPASEGGVWDFKYLKNKTFTSISGDLASDIGDAATFDEFGLGSAESWIESLFGTSDSKTIDGRTFKRANFVGVSHFYLNPDDEWEYKHVATSETVVVPKTYITEKFTLHHMGSEEDRMVFLSYRPSGANRFYARNTTPKDFDTRTLNNLKLYEESIREVDSSDTNVRNYVYMKDTNGFYPVGNWLVLSGSGSNVHSEIKGELITEYNGQQETRIGPGLAPGEKFTCELEWESQDSSGNPVAAAPMTFDFVFGVTASTEPTSWNGLIGTCFGITAKFTELDSENPKVKVYLKGGSETTGGTCYSMTEIPDTRRVKNIVDITEYTLEAGDVDRYTLANEDRNVFVEETNQVTQEDGTSVHTIKKISFIPLVKVIQKKLALNLGHAYMAFNGMYVKCASGDLDTQYIIPMRDFGGNNVGSLKYGYLSVPLGIDDASDIAYYNSLLGTINDDREARG